MKFIFIFLMCCIFLTGCANNSDKKATPAENIDYNVERLSYGDIQKETVISTFSTPILVQEEDRQTNITIACGILNGTIVKKGETFSFCDTVGPSNPEDGYKKANAFDNDGDTIQEYGGGKCQISSTLYNAVLAIPELTIVERHEHSGPAPYVAEHMDACVSYSASVDFKFTNNTDFDIKIYASNTPDSVNISIAKLSS